MKPNKQQHQQRPPQRETTDLAVLNRPEDDQEAAPEASASGAPGEPDLIDRIVEYLRDVVPADQLRAFAEDWRAEFGGAEIYVRSPAQLERQRRISAVLRHFNGANAREVARRLGVSRATVYRVLKQSR